MLKYRFPNDVYELTSEGHKIVEKRTIILYKCLICQNFSREWDDTWTDEKKAQVQLEVDTHHNDHIV